MKIKGSRFARSPQIRLLLAILLAFIATRAATAQDLSKDLVSYWPLDEVQGTKTPDLVSGYDMDLNNLSAADLVVGKVGKAFNFSNTNKTLLSRVHKAGEELPINQHPAFTISFWEKVQGNGQADLRLFSEASTTSSDPLFNLGTHNTDGTLDVFIRQSGWTTVNHIVTVGQPLDDTWHQITFVQQADGSRKLYVDGTADELEIPAKEAGDWKVNDTTIGGILRASPGFWVTGLIDDVAVWKRALTEAEIKTVSTDGLKSVFPPLANGLVSHWPLDEVKGTKTPDVVSGYDMDLNNLTADDLTAGKVGKAFNFSNAKKTLLSRVHKAGEALPINQHPAFTVSMWAKVQGTGQADLRLFSEASTTSSDPLFNLGTHNTDGTLDVFLRQSGWTTVNHIVSVNQPLDDTWRHIAFVQQADGARKLYFDGVADELEIPAKEAGSWLVNDTTIGGILRASPGFWVTGLIDEVALWKRALSPEELADVVANGVPKVFAKKLPLEIRSFTTDFAGAAAGGKATLRWQASADATLTITPGIGDVSAFTQFGAGSTQVTVSQTTTYTLTAERDGETLTSQVTVGAVPGVAANWQLLDNFNFSAPGGIVGKGGWSNPEGIITVVDLGANKAMGIEDGNDLAALPLSSLALKEGQKATLFFRLYVSTNDPVSLITATFGLTDRPIRFNGDFNGNVGPYLRLERLFEGSTIDLLAHNNVGAGYDYQVDAIQPGFAYNIWIDIENKPFDVVDGIQIGGDIYSAYLQKNGDANRTVLFQDYVSDRDAVNIDPALGAPTTNLTHLFISAIGASQGTNNVLFDDFYLSTGAFNSTVPVAASSFVPTPKAVTITGFGYNLTAKSFTLSWGSAAGATYKVLRKNSLSDPAWTTVVSDYPSGGTTTTYTDTSAPPAGGYYIISQ